MRRIVMDRVPRGPRLRTGIRSVTRLGIRVEPRPVGGCDLQPDPVTDAEQVGRRDEVHLDLRDLAHRQQLGTIRAVAVPDPADALGEVEGATVRSDIHELGRDIEVGRLR